MALQAQVVVPAAKSIKDFESLMKTKYEFVILLDVHIAQLTYIRRLAKDSDKKLILHADLIQGLRHDQAGAQFLCQIIKPAGLISTHSNVIATAKKHGVVSIQRIFLLDSHSLETSLRVLNTAKPDYIEVLPGMMPQVLQEVSRSVDTPIIAGGFIRAVEDVELILNSGATAVTTSSAKLWRHYELGR